MGGGAKYFGERSAAGCKVYVRHGRKWVPLHLQPNLAKYSPAGFEWGSMSSGAAKLALSILAEHLKNQARALELFEDFEFKVVSRLDRNQWLLTVEEIDSAIREIDRGQKGAA